MTNAFYFVFDSYEDARDCLPEFVSPRRETLLAAAAANRREAVESFDRCDTDGFLSQWASNCTANDRESEARLADNGDLTIGPALADIATGAIVCIGTTRMHNRFAHGIVSKWVVRRPGERNLYLTDYVNPARFADYGLRKVWLLAPAKLYGNYPLSWVEPPRGLSGAGNYRGKTEFFDLDCFPLAA